MLRPVKGEAAPDAGDWATDGDRYDPDSFYTASTDEKGHGRVMSLRVPPVMQGMVSEIVNSHEYPAIRSVADFFRDAAIHRLHYLKSEMQASSVLMADIEREVQRAELARIKNRLDEDRRLINDVNEQLAECAATGDAETFEYVADLALGLAEPFSKYSVKQLLGVIRKNRAQLKATLDGGEKS